MHEWLSRVLNIGRDLAERVAPWSKNQVAPSPLDEEEAWARAAIAATPDAYAFAPLEHTDARREALDKLEAESRAAQRI